MAKPKRNSTSNERKFTSQESLNNYIKGVCDILRRSNCTGALQYVPELTWILFLRILDDHEEQEAAEAAAVGASFTPSLESPFRWRDWAAPPTGTLPGMPGWKREQLTNGALGDYFSFIHTELLPYLKELRNRPNSNPRQKVISEILSGVEKVRVDTEKNFLDVLDRVHEIRSENIDSTHIFTLSQVYEGLLLKMGSKGNDGGQYFTPREVIRAIIQTVDPRPGETVYDPCCGTGGFLAQAYEYMQNHLPDTATPDLIEMLKQNTFYGREKENLIYPIALANLVLHGIDTPRLWHGNTLTGQEIYGGLFQEAPGLHDVILTNPPFRGKEGVEAQTNFSYKTSSTQVLFLQHVIDSLKPGGRCGMVVDEGVLFRTNEIAYVQTKRKLLEECDLWCIVSLPQGVFTAAGAGVKTDLLFFTRGGPTKQIWYYDLSDLKVGKTKPLKLTHFNEFYNLLPNRADSEHSWTVSRAEVEAKNYDLKADNPHIKNNVDTRSPDVILDLIEDRNKEFQATLARLRQ